MAQWLYPISTRSAFGFELGDGTEVVPSVKNFKELVYNERIAEDPLWHISRDFDNIQLGDEIFIYTGERDTGIVGYATVARKEGHNRATWHIELKFNFDKCKELLEKPVSAKIIRTWFNPRNAVMPLHKFEAEFNALLPWEQAEIEGKLAELAEDMTLSTGQGFNSSPESRRIIENHSMKSAINYYENLGYQVQDVSARRSYDLHCINGDCNLLVEVKGTQSDGQKVFLTKNEVTNTRKNKGAVSLYILHSIQINNNGDELEAVGGTEYIINPWDIEHGTLTPMVFEYKIPTK